MYTYMYIHTYIHTNIYTHIHIYTYIHTYLYTYTRGVFVGTLLEVSSPLMSFENFNSFFYAIN